MVLEAYRARFTSVQTGLAGEVSQGLGLIEELLEKLEHTETLLTQTKLDLDNEQETRRRLQQEIQENRGRKERFERRPFVVAVIDADADAYVFNDDFITRGEKGGEDAADALLAALQQFVRELTGIPNSMDILVRAFANVSGLGRALERYGRLQDANQLRAFATGFSNRQAFFDFVDVGSGKERADMKIRESIRFFVESFQCKHLVIACGHDSGYAPSLGQLVGDKQVAERITLLEGSPFPAAIRNLGLKKIRFRSIFNEVPQPTDPVGASWSNVAKAPKVARPVAVEPGVPSGPVKPFTGYYNPNAKSNRLGPALKGANGRRVDKPLMVDQLIVERIKKGDLCFWLFLRGECVSPKCRRNHAHRQLTDEEFDALWWISRQQAWCFKNQKVNQTGKDCSDPMCVYRHRSGAQQEN